MSHTGVRALLFVALAISVMIQAATPAKATTYAAMAPLAQYLTPARSEEIDLARTAAVPAISSKATILVLTSHGYETAQTGSNGFTCLVERAWVKSFDDDQFWNASVRTPVCYNAEASQTVLRYTQFRTGLALAGASQRTIREKVQTAVANKQLPPVAPGSMAYMTSKAQYIDDHVKAWYPHIMFYAPKNDGADSGRDWGADRKGSPVVYDSGHLINPEPWSLFFVPVAHWSDGTMGPSM